MISQQLKPFFWDTNVDIFEPAAYPAYTIARLLEFGDPAAVEWLRATFPEDQIVGVLRTDRRLSPRTANFWALVYHIPPGDVASLKFAR
ncbi:MAG TPA: hypothetical protein VL523_08420 [Terriglobia bacterium]|nr:hypothetical protein [Terriglobia bacterium]